RHRWRTPGASSAPSGAWYGSDPSRIITSTSVIFIDLGRTVSVRRHRDRERGSPSTSRRRLHHVRSPPYRGRRQDAALLVGEVRELFQLVIILRPGRMTRAVF